MVGQSDHALALLDKDESPEAERLRADIFWGRQDWANAAQVLGRLVRRRAFRPSSRSTTGRGWRSSGLTIALTLSGNERGLTRARSDYGPLMAETPYADAFRLIASPPENGVIDYRRCPPR